MPRTQYISPEGLRLDGRRVNEIRRVKCELGVYNTRMDGSCVYEHGNTRVVSCVYGPREVSRYNKDGMNGKAVITCEYSVASFSTSERRLVRKGDRRSTEIAMLIRRTFEAVVLTHLYPRSEINIFVQVLQSDGGEKHAAINATMLALVNAGIPMKCFVSACSAGFIDGQPLVDLNYRERVGGGGPELLIAVDANSNNIICSQMENKLPVEHVGAVVEQAQKGCALLYSVLSDAIKEFSYRTHIS